MISAVLGRGRRRGAGWRVGVAASMLAASTVASVIAAGSGVASAAPGDLDPGFGSAGVVQDATGTGASATGVAVDGAGRIVVSTDGGSASQFELARFTPSGVIDTTFGTAKTPGFFDPFPGQANAVAVAPSGLVAAVGEEATSPSLCGGEQPVVDLVPNTTPVLIPCPAGSFGGTLNAVTVDSAGNIIAAGEVSSSTGGLETLVAKVAPSGTVSYGTATPIGTSQSAAMGVGVSGSDVYTAGYSYNQGTQNLTVAAFNPSTGILDQSFGPSGTLTAPSGFGNAVAVLPNGNLAVAGQASGAAFLAEYTATGGSTSFSPPPASLGVTDYQSVIYQPNGAYAYPPMAGFSLVAAGTGSGSSPQMVAAIFDPASGAPNTLFGGGLGALAITFPQGASSAVTAMAAQPDGKTIVAGNAPITNQSPELGLARVEIDPIVGHYLTLGGSSSYLGQPVGAEGSVAGGRFQNYRGGTIYWSRATGAWAVRGAILSHYRALNGPGGVLGFPTSDEQGTADGVARFNTFAGNDPNGGAIYWTPRTGAQEMHGPIYGKFVSLGGEAGFLGVPITDQTGTPDGIGQYNRFSNDAYIYWSPSTGAHSIQGAILAKWASLGYEHSFLGYPTSDEQGTADGARFNTFSGIGGNGAIYWRANTGAWSVYGAIYAKFVIVGESVLGVPVTDQTVTPDGVGRYNRFSNNAYIYWTPSTGAQSIHGAILATWASLGYERSRLGYPTSDEFAVRPGRRNNFQHGFITWIAATGATVVTYR